LHEGAEGTIEDDDALVERIEVGLPHGRHATGGPVLARDPFVPARTLTPPI
jgi:hypothetical protein